MGLLDFLFPERRNTAVVARDRLKIVLAHERASRDAPDFLPALQKDLLDVVGRYVEIRGDMLRVNVGQVGRNLAARNQRRDRRRQGQSRSKTAPPPPTGAGPDQGGRGPTPARTRPGSSPAEAPTPDEAAIWAGHFTPED